MAGRDPELSVRSSNERRALSRWSRVHDDDSTVNIVAVGYGILHVVACHRLIAYAGGR